jgi:UDP-4-amino-4,6-dideoxy-N-acetyl-beta-L-altrosamine N-acetyltransferase
MISLIDITEEDLDLIRQWRTSDQVTRYQYTDPVLTIDDQKKWFEENKNDETSIYKIISYKGKDKIGLVSFTEIDNFNRRCVWGFYIGDEKARTRGLGAIATYHILNYVFGELRMNKICSEVLEYNKEALALNSKFGFHQEAHYREHRFKYGKFHDSYGFSLLRSDWIKTLNYFKKIFGDGRKN